jgi:mono/diheme cytochrome c family protein
VFDPNAGVRFESKSWGRAAEAWRPGYSRDGQLAIVLFAISSGLHGATATYVLALEDGAWKVRVRQFVYYHEPHPTRWSPRGDARVDDRCLGAEPPAQTEAARGRYLAQGIARCFWCHAPLDDGDPATPKAGTLGSGDVLDEKTPVVAPNITPDVETGIGRWTDAEIARAIREGIGRDGRALRSDHPSHYYSVMTDEDASAIAVYLRSLPPISRPLRRSAPQRNPGETVQPAVRPALAATLRSESERGAYLVQLGECRGCHTTTTRDGRPERGMEFGGGRRFRIEKGVGIEFDPDPAFTAAAQRRVAGEDGLVASANITPDPSGVAFYTREVFIQTIRTGHVAGVEATDARRCPGCSSGR